MKIKRLSSKLLFFFLAAVLIAGIIFTGCSRAVKTASDELGSFNREAEMAVMEEAVSEAPAADMEVMEEEAGASEKTAIDSNVQYGETAVAVDRKVIKNAYLEIEIEKGKFQETMFELTNLAEQNGGFVTDSQSYSDSEGNLTSGYITLRVPSNKFNSALDKIKEIGTIRDISTSGQDITQEYVDLESRLRNYEAQEKILLELMEKSTKVSDSIEVQKELSNVQGEIEVIKGRMNYLDDMVSFSTISVNFHEPDPLKTATGWGFVEALKKGLRGAVTAFNWIVMVLIATIPLWIILGIAGLIVWQIIKARKRRRAIKEQKK